MFIEFETIVQVKRFQYLSDAITEIILANGGRSGCAGATAPTRSTRRRRTAWLNSKRCISNLVFDTTLSSGREMGIRPTAIARREEVAADRTRTRGRRMSHQKYGVCAGCDGGGDLHQVQVHRLGVAGR
jgi:hypothetical protein